MLLLVTGASGAGKSEAFRELAAALVDRPVTCRELDAIGVPARPDTAWRHGALEHWVQRARDAQPTGRHLVLCGQVPIGELLAAPSTISLDAVRACLLHCSPTVRRERLIGRGEDPDALNDHLDFGEWLYRHTLDPTHDPNVIRVASDVPMRWDRWASWRAGDPRWTFSVINTDALTRAQVASRVIAWALDTLAGHLPVLTPSTD